jgi:hypothetical protein
MSMVATVPRELVEPAEPRPIEVGDTVLCKPVGGEAFEAVVLGLDPVSVSHPYLAERDGARIWLPALRTRRKNPPATPAPELPRKVEP